MGEVVEHAHSRSKMDTTGSTNEMRQHHTSGVDDSGSKWACARVQLKYCCLLCSLVNQDVFRFAGTGTLLLLSLPYGAFGVHAQRRLTTTAPVRRVSLRLSLGYDQGIMAVILRSRLET